MIQLLCDREIQSYVGWFQSNHCISHFFSQWLDTINQLHLSTVISLVYLIVWYMQPEGNHSFASCSKTGRRIWNILSPPPKTKNLFNFENLLIFMFNCKWLGFFLMSGLLRYKNTVYIVILSSLTDWVFEYICNPITALY